MALPLALRHAIPMLYPVSASARLRQINHNGCKYQNYSQTQQVLPVCAIGAIYAISEQRFSRMSFEEQLNLCARLVDDRLTNLLNPSLPASGSTAVDFFPTERLAEAMRHAVLGGGKRFRPFLLMQSAALFGIPFEQSVTAAAALEAVHCYSLVHDDLPAMDDDDLRRGQPTVHKAYDEATAILAGDALLTLAFEILCHRATHENPAIRMELVSSLARAAGWAGMAGGQQLDLDAENLSDASSTTIDGIFRLQAMKTGALIQFACTAGAILGGAGKRQRQALVVYAQNLGRAFQISDDLLDVEGSFEDVGKAVGKDDGAGKATLVSLLGTDAARAALEQMESDAIAALEGFDSHADPLREAARYLTRRKT